MVTAGHHYRYHLAMRHFAAYPIDNHGNRTASAPIIADGHRFCGGFTGDFYRMLRHQQRKLRRALMLAARRREIDVVAVWRFDRFARSLSHLVVALTEFRALGVQFVSHQEGIDTSTPIGMAMFQIAGAMAELEANLARERVQAGLDAARARGVVVGRPRAALTPQEAEEAVHRHGGLRPAAKALGLAPSLLARRLAEARSGAG